MPNKSLELTIDLNILRVSCPGVWLCQDGRVGLSVFALGTSYQTCLLPPVFPLMYNDHFYFRKRFRVTCSGTNMRCLFKDETIYCELVQWSEDCRVDKCTILAQYLGALNDVLLPSNICSNKGVDLLMRRTRQFPGILSPKIEIATKVCIDQVWQQCLSSPNPNAGRKKPCACNQKLVEQRRQDPVCHTPLYHRIRCNHTPLPRSRSSGSKSLCNLITTPNKRVGQGRPDSAYARTTACASERPSACPSARNTPRQSACPTPRTSSCQLPRPPPGPTLHHPTCQSACTSASRARRCPDHNRIV